MDPMIKLILAQGMLGLSNGVFYAMLSLGLAIIFGLLNVVNFAHGALYMTGAFVALILYSYLGAWLGHGRGCTSASGRRWSSRRWSSAASAC